MLRQPHPDSLFVCCSAGVKAVQSLDHSLLGERTPHGRSPQTDADGLSTTACRVPRMAARCGFVQDIASAEPSTQALRYCPAWAGATACSRSPAAPHHCRRRITARTYALYPVHRFVLSLMLEWIVRAVRKERYVTSIQIGDRAPDFTLPSQTGEQVSLADLRSSKAVVLFFYPKDGTAVCTKEACSFRDAYEDFVKAGAVVIGVSSDSTESHQAFASGHRLPFVLLSDAEGSLRKAFGVPKTLGIMPGRVTYVIDKEQMVRHMFSSQFAADRHVSEALAVVRQLSES